MVTSHEPAAAPHIFDLSGGALCLDFANTVSNRGSDTAIDRLAAYGDFLAWCEQSGAAAPAQIRELSKLAAAHPSAARDALARAIEFREALYRLFASAAAQRRPRPADLAVLNDHIPIAYKRSRVASVGDGYVLKVEAAPDDLLSPLAPVIKSAVDLLTSPTVDRVRTCAADTCEWLFLDTTKNRTRRWCDMKVCGNREKVRRFRSRG
jgi:predicted RNA-binding Zn ribbon-like protein